ncbi:MAG: M48 family metalloprotease [Pseudomonadota bacterium]
MLAALVALAASCGGSPSEQRLLTGGLPPGAIPPAPKPEDIERSAEHQRLVEAYGGVYEFKKIEDIAAGLVSRLVGASDQPQTPVKVTILNSPAVNAFALPDGELYITRGLTALANDESELAAVIAHELAHVTQDHARQRQRQQRAAALARRVSDVVADPEVKLETREVAELSRATFSQRQELQADAMGVNTLANAGFDPFAAARFLQSMARYSSLPAVSATRGRGAGFLSSHPSTPNRVAQAKRVARSHAAPGLGVTQRDRYLKSLDGMLYGDDPHRGYVRGREFANVKLGIAFEVPEGYALRNTADAVLATDGQNTAIRFDTVSVPDSQSLSEYLASGWVKGLIPDTIRKTTLRGLEAATASALVDGWSFRIAAVRGPRGVYRFIFASSQPAAAYEDAFRRTLASFKIMSPSDRAALRPLRIRIVEVQPTDTIESLSARMDGVEGPLKQTLFETLNGLGEDRTLRPGMLVKLVME